MIAQPGGHSIMPTPTIVDKWVNRTGCGKLNLRTGDSHQTGRLFQANQTDQDDCTDYSGTPPAVSGFAAPSNHATDRAMLSRYPSAGRQPSRVSAFSVLYESDRPISQVA